MAYNVPEYNNVNFEFAGGGYSPPAYNSVEFVFTVGGGGIPESGVTLFLAFNF